MKKALSIAGSIISWLIIILSLFFGLSVLGKRLWITTQFGTIFFFMVLPFLILFLLIDYFTAWDPERNSVPLH